jgi:ankyrin repeat protein
VSSQGLKINQTDSKGLTALHHAAAEGEEAIVRLLVHEFKVDVNQSNKQGETALHLAVERGYGGVMRLLIQELRKNFS